MSAASTTRSVRPRRPASLSAASTAPAARIEGIGSRSNPKPRSLRTSSSARPRAAPTASAARRSRAVESPAGPSIAGHVASSRRIGPPNARSRAGRSARNGRSRRIVREAGGRPAEQRRPPPELDPQVHDRPFPLGIDRRVRHLGERLAEMVGDRPVDPAETRRRRVVAHAPQRLVALESHRPDVEPGVLGVEAGEEPQVRRPSAGPSRTSDESSSPAPGRRGPVRGASWIGRRRRRCAFASTSSRTSPRAGSTRNSSPGPSRPRRTVSSGGERDRAGLGADRDEPVAGHRERGRAGARSGRRSPRPAGRRRRRSPRARPTARGSRRSGGEAPRPAGAARAGGPAPRASPSGARCRDPSRSRRAARGASSSDCESEPSADRSGPAADELGRQPLRRSRPARPRTWARLPRTVLISPLWAIERNGWASRQVGWVFVA